MLILIKIKNINSQSNMSKKQKTKASMITLTNNLMRCAPKQVEKLKKLKDKNTCSCFTIKQLRTIAKVWNESEPNHMIKLRSTMRKCEIWETVSSTINKHTKCKKRNEQCWLTLSQLAQFARDTQDHDMFRPLWPNEWFDNTKQTSLLWHPNNTSSTNNWLSSHDIWNVMKQYETPQYQFSFFGVVPIDFSDKKSLFHDECIATSYRGHNHDYKSLQQLCSFSKSKLGKNTEQFGVVFNTGKDGTEGEHWVSLYGKLNRNNKKKPVLIYFDSIGREMPERIKKYIESIQSELKTNVKIIQNKKPHQIGGAECGVYSIHFLINMLQGVPFRQFNKKLIDDYKMIQMREVYFNKYD